MGSVDGCEAAEATSEVVTAVLAGGGALRKLVKASSPLPPLEGAVPVGVSENQQKLSVYQSYKMSYMCENRVIF